MERQPVVGVMGGGSATPETKRLAEELGAAIAREGWILLNGGRNAGVMAASAAGARQAGGLVVGILPGGDRTEASPDLTVAVVTGLGEARNALNILSSDVVVALPGAAGTLNEIALAGKNDRPLVLLGWETEPASGALEASRAKGRVVSCATAADAIRHVQAYLAGE